jgi:hypothetical protein
MIRDLFAGERRQVSWKEPILPQIMRSPVAWALRDEPQILRLRCASLRMTPLLEND